jgi:hypothetical protein
MIKYTKVGDRFVFDPYMGNRWRRGSIEFSTHKGKRYAQRLSWSMYFPGGLYVAVYRGEATTAARYKWTINRPPNSFNRVHKIKSVGSFPTPHAAAKDAMITAAKVLKLHLEATERWVNWLTIRNNLKAAMSRVRKKR